MKYLYFLQKKKKIILKLLYLHNPLTHYKTKWQKLMYMEDQHNATKKKLLLRVQSITNTNLIFFALKLQV